MALSNSQLQARLELIETQLNTIQTAFNNVATRRELKNIMALITSQISSLEEENIGPALDEHIDDFDTHTANTAIHFSEGEIDHGSIDGLSDNDHPQYALLGSSENITGLWTFDTHPSGLDHTESIANVGTNTHPQIDTHIANDSIHGGGGATDHGGLTGLSDDDHTQYLLEDGSRAMSGALELQNGSKVDDSSDGVVLLTDNAATDFSRLTLGGITSSFPALARSTTNLRARLADNSDYTFFDGKHMYEGDANTYSHLPQADEVGFVASGVDMLGVDGGNNWVKVKSGALKLPNNSLITDTSDGLIEFRDSANQLATITTGHVIIQSAEQEHVEEEFHTSSLIIKACVDHANTAPLIQLQDVNGDPVITLHSDDETNVFIGVDAGQANTTGTNNFFFGHEAGYSNTTGSANVAMGVQALRANTDGITNVAIGSTAMLAADGASYNVAIGRTALTSITTTDSNVAIGEKALRYHTTGGANTAIGRLAGEGVSGQSIASNNNVFIGYLSGRAITRGDDNTFLGKGTGGVTTGKRNILIGAGITASAVGVDDEINIGGLLVGNAASNTLTIDGKPTISSDSIIITTTQSPASNGTGTQGEIAWDADYLYVCVNTNEWKRCALTGGY